MTATSNYKSSLRRASEHKAPSQRSAGERKAGIAMACARSALLYRPMMPRLWIGCVFLQTRLDLNELVCSPSIVPELFATIDIGTLRNSQSAGNDGPRTR